MTPHPDLTPSVIFGLGWLYLILFVMNAWWTVRSVKGGGHFRSWKVLGGQDVPTSAGWAVYSALLLMVAVTHLSGSSSPEKFPLRLPDWFKWIVDTILADPKSYSALSVLLFVLMIVCRRWLVNATVAWVMLNLTLVFMALSLTDYDFRQIVGKPDNVPIVGMLFLVGFFTWLYFARAVENDRRIEDGVPLIEEEDNEKVLVWPDLVYTELICMVALTAFLVAWGIVLQAPLEEPASSVKTPNPSKAPWYFLGLQEMLVYFDPWLAGVVFPTVIIVGMMAIPYIDFNKLGNGYYTFNQRKFAVVTFMFGFLPLWVALIILGTFLRGPNWNIFGIYEYWDSHKLEALNNVDLSQFVWHKWLGQPFPTSKAGSGVGAILLKESVGIILVLLYFLVPPYILARTVFSGMFARMGFLRYMVLVNLVLLMAALPIKMLLRWAFNLKYIVAIPEWFFNI